MARNEKEMEDWLNQGLEESVEKAVNAPPRTIFPTVPSGVGVPKPQIQQQDKPKSLQTIGISKGGVVRNASTVVRQQLNNPVANPKANSGKSSIIDRAELTPEFGVPTLMRGMDANLEEEAKEKLEQALPSAPPPPTDKPPAQKMITLRTSLHELLEFARLEGGSLSIGTRQFSLKIVINDPF